ncbi:MAG TPA: hypothetical protein VJV23_00490 [Candidatus Polarisedimenticolia bacterium]|nr:hypothetical protein [Candidatus Polarisedimenticolia bacterium]
MPSLHRASWRAARRSLPAAAPLATAGVCLAAAAALSPCWAGSRTEEAVPSLPAAPVALSWRAGAAGADGGATATALTTPITLPAAGDLFRRDPGPAPSMFSEYRKALEKESRRLREKHPSAFWNEDLDEDGYPLRGVGKVQRDARRIFEGAGSRVATRWLEDQLDDSPGARAARSYIEGLRMDLRRGGGLRVQAGDRAPAREERDSAASVTVMVAGRPRIELRSQLPGDIRARVEVPLGSLGFRATMSRRFAAGIKGTLSGGVEDGGDDRWVSAGIEIGF